MVTDFPFAIGASVFGILGLLFYSFGGEFMAAIKKLSAGFQYRIDRADMAIKPEEFGLIVIGAGVVLWIAIVLVLRTSPLISLFVLPLTVALSVLAGSGYLRFKGDRRVNGFVQQLELVSRMLAGALRVGLGLRQAIILVTEEVPNPARREFMRVIGRTNLGIPIVDALDELAAGMPSQEMIMFSRVIRVQSSTGGDLAKILERLAGTIRDRRRIVRKMGALTAQGRFGAAIIGGLPIVIGSFIVVTQPEMGHALLHTHFGWIMLGIVAGLEIAAIFVLRRILQLEA